MNISRPRRTKARLGTMTAIGMLGVAVSTSLLAGGHAAAATGTLDLAAETFNVQSSGSIDLTVSLPSGIALPADDFTVTITAFRPVATRSAVADAIAGRLPRVADSVDVPASSVQHPAPNELRVIVPVEVTTRTPPALQLSKPGLYPVTVEVQVSGDVVASLTTFVHRLPGAQEDPETPMPVALATTTDVPVQLDDHAQVTIDSTTLQELTTLAELLETSAVPVSVRIPPAVLTALDNSGADGAALVARLNQAMQHHNLLSAPALPLDPSAAAAANQQALYTQWLRDGEDSLAKSVSATSQRTIVLVDQPLSEAGGILLRDLGARLFVMPAAIYDSLPNSIANFTDTTQLVQVQLTAGVTVDAAIVDRTASRMLSRETTTPLLTAIESVADLLAARQQVEDLGGDPRRHSLTLATPDLTLPSTAGWAEFTTLLGSTPGLRPTTLDELSVRTDQLLGPDGPIVVNLPPKVDGSIGARVALTTQLGGEAVSTASMLPSDDQRTLEWNRLLGTLPTSALSDARANAIADGLRTEFAALRTAVVVSPGLSFNLTGRKGTIPITLRNNADVALKVRLRLSSSKLLFPDGEQIVTLAPDAITHVQVAVDARTNGRFPVALEVFAPIGDARLAPIVPLTASITALSGVGTLLTAAALLLLLTWWGRHIRRSRRGRRAGAAAQRHPTTRPGADDAPALSPDAETSTLPPS